MELMYLLPHMLLTSHFYSEKILLFLFFLQHSVERHITMNLSHSFA